MKPPSLLYLNSTQGFNAITKSGTLWRPTNILCDPLIKLVQFEEHSFFQLNDNATKAIYKARRYPYKIAIWFDNVTGKRIG